MKTETDKQYATRILFQAAARIARLEPMLLKERTEAVNIRKAIEAMSGLEINASRKSILAAMTAELIEAENAEAETFNMLQDDYKDRRKMSEFLSAQAARERRAAQA
jgi:hypothetical protein